MPIEYRNISADEFTHWRTTVWRGFGNQIHPEDIERLRNDRAEIDRLWGAFDGDELVGTGGADSHLLTVPGGAKLPVGGIAYVGSAATHRRQGVLTGTMRKLLDQAREREEPLSALWSSQASIYGRFGFGPATISEKWKIENGRTEFAHSPAIPGHVRFVEREEALKLMPRVWEKASDQHAGFVDRSLSRWRYFFFDEERVRGGSSAMFYIVYQNGGEPEGYAAYRLKHPEPDDDAMDLQVIESVSTNDAAHAAIWQLLLNTDLVLTYRASNRPPDDPVWWMLADPRRLERTPEDGLWLRVIDVEKALEARSFAGEGRIVVEVRDSFVPDAGGVFELDVSTGSARCGRSTKMPDVSLTTSELGAAYLGQSRVTAAARAGLAEEHTDGALRLFDRMFSTQQAPWCAHHF